MKIPKAPEIVACVKEAYYDEVNDGWTYVVQEKDSTGKWYGPERAKRAKHLKRAGESEQVFPSPAPTLATNLLPEDDESPRKVDYTEDKVQQDADLQIKGSDWMSDNKSRGFYRRVFVLLLSWYPDCDDLAVDEEVITTFEKKVASVSNVFRCNVWGLRSKTHTILMLSQYTSTVVRQ